MVRGGRRPRRWAGGSADMVRRASAARAARQGDRLQRRVERWGAAHPRQRAGLRRGWAGIPGVTWRRGRRWGCGDFRAVCRWSKGQSWSWYGSIEYQGEGGRNAPASADAASERYPCDY